MPWVMRSGLLLALALRTSAEGHEHSEPYFCDIGLANFRLGWSEGKKKYCCREHRKGCETRGATPPVGPLATPAGPLTLAASPLGHPDEHAPKDKNHTHMVPPWWIVAGIKPAGTTVDYGPYTAAGFSKAQQFQFGVNATGHILNFQRFRVATKALQPCIDPKEKQMGLNQKEMMQLLGEVLEDAWDELTDDDPGLKDWTRLRSSCQQHCMTNVLSWSLRTLWSTGDLLSRGGGASFSSALADAVRACYPGFRALRADDVAHKVGKIVARGLETKLPMAAARGDFTGRRLSFNQNPSCLQPSSLDAEDRQRFVFQLEVAVEKAVKTAESRSWGMMEQAARPCQQVCRRAVVKQAGEMLWDAGLLARGNADMLVMTSVEGALAACLTNLPKDAAEALAGEAMLHMRPPSESDSDSPGRTLLSRGPIRPISAREEIEGLRFSELPFVSLALVGLTLVALIPLARALLTRLRDSTPDEPSPAFALVEEGL